MFHLILMVGVAFAGKNDACDHLKGENQRICVKKNYPKIRAKVNETCANKPDNKKYACRVEQYRQAGIQWNKPKDNTQANTQANTQSNTQEHTACDHLKGENQRICVKDNYPKIREKVNETCANKPENKKVACRVEQYRQAGIQWNSNPKNNAQDNTQDSTLASTEASPEVSSVASSDTSSETSSETSSDTSSQGTKASTKTSTKASSQDTTACDQLKGEKQRNCIKNNYPDIREQVNEACAAKPDNKKSDCRVTQYRKAGIQWNSNPKSNMKDYKISPRAKISATVTLAAAGAVMMAVPNRCPQNDSCNLSRKDQKAIGSFGKLVAAIGPQTAAILATSKSDYKKAKEIVGLLRSTVKQAPEGLSDDAQDKVDKGVIALRATISLFEL